MPYKHNQKNPKTSKARCRVTNWPEYNKALCKRGDITVWFSEEVKCTQKNQNGIDYEYGTSRKREK